MFCKWRIEISYWYVISPEELYHYGVKGMKWRRRKAINNAVETASNSVGGKWKSPNGTTIYAVGNQVVRTEAPHPRSRKKKVTNNSKGVKRKSRVNAGKRYGLSIVR